MPRIPTRDSLRQGVPRSTGGIVRAPRDFVGPSLERAGNQVFQEADQAIRKEREQQSSLELARARSEWNTALLTEQNSYNTQDRPDYGSWEKKYNSRAPILQNKAADNISDPTVRERFKLETNDDRVRVGLSINNNARKIATQARLTAADTSLDKLVNNAAQLDDADAQGVFADIKATLQDLVDTGVISKEEAASRSVKYARRFAAIRGKQLVDNDPVQARSILSGEKASPASLIKRFEGFRTTPYWDVNALRTGYGSDTITTASGQVVKVKAGMTVSRADAERDLERRIGEFQGVIRKQIGDKQFEGLAPNVQAALTSMAYNYGSLPNSVAKAAKGGNVEKIADAIEVRATDNEGINQKRRFEEAAVVRGSDGNVYAAMGQRPLWAGSLDAQTRSTLLATADRQVQRMDNQSIMQDKVRAEELKEGIKSDIQSIYSTGVPTDINPDAVLRELGPTEHRQFLEAREDAAQVFSATEDLPTLSEEQISQVLQANRPESGSDNFARKQAVFEEIEKQANVIRTERRENPSQAAMRIPSVTRAMSEAQDPRTTSPAKVQAFIREMIATQSTFGVPRSAIAPVPDRWAFEIGKVLLKMPTEVTRDNADQVAQAVTAIYQSMEEQYGEHADDVIAYSIGKTKALSKDMSKHVTTLLKAVSQGRPITRAARQSAMLRDQEQAESASGSWWNPASWFGADTTPVDVDRDKMPTRDEMISVMTMEDEAAKAEALQALKDRYGEESVSAAQAMYQ